MTQVEKLAEFASGTSWDDLSSGACDALKVRMLDSIGCAIGALDSGPPRIVRDHVVDLGGRPSCSLIGGGRSAPDRAALLNGALVRYLDFNDAYLAPGETCHPSDSIGAVLAAADYGERSGRDFLVALAVAYAVQCRLSDVVPVRERGFDHTVQLAYGAAAGASRALVLDVGATSHAVAIAGTALNGLRVTRTGALSHWKGLAAPFTAAGALDAAFLAGRGVTGPLEVFEGVKGFEETLGGSVTIDWSVEDLALVTRTALKRFNAEIHSQTAIETALALRDEHGIAGPDVAAVDIETFQVAYDIIGGGREGDKGVVRTKEQADHSLPYLVAVALLDGEVLPAQFAPERIERADVQALLSRVVVRPATDLTARFPADQPCRMRITLTNGRTVTREQTDYQGWPTLPMSWEDVTEKFDQLAAPHTSEIGRADLIGAVADLDHIEVTDLTQLLHDVGVRRSQIPPGR